MLTPITVEHSKAEVYFLALFQRPKQNERYVECSHMYTYGTVNYANYYSIFCSCISMFWHSNKTEYVRKICVRVHQRHILSCCFCLLFVMGSFHRMEVNMK